MKKFRFFCLFALVFSFGLVLVGPVAAEETTDCPTLASGDLFKVTGHSAVYMLDDNLRRLYFPNSEVFHTWFADFSNVVEISESCVENYPAPLDPPFGVNFRPGSRLVKVKISPSVYVVEPGNKLRKIGSEDVARELYGPNWANLVRDVADSFWPNFPGRGLEMKEAKPHDGMFLRVPGVDGVYYVEDGVLKKLEDASEVDKDDIRVVGKGVFVKLAVHSGFVKAKRAFFRAHQKVKKLQAKADKADEDSEEEKKEKLKVCHIPPGDPENKKTLDVSNSALKAHLAHGDSEGECESSDEGGDEEETDTTAPVISDLSSTVSSTSAVVVWFTNESGESTFNYGTSTTTYDVSVEVSSVQEGELYKHTAEMTDLSLGTYYFKVESTDAIANKAEATGEFTIE